MKKLLLLALFNLLINFAYTQWVSTNGPSGGAISMISKDPTTNYIYAVSEFSGIFLSKDNGVSWEAVNNGLPIHIPTTSIAINGNTIIASTFSGIFISDNNGSSWRNASDGIIRVIRTLIVDNNNIYAGTDQGVYISTNNGLNWESKNNGLPEYLGVKSLIINTNNIYIGTPNGVFMSSNNGDSWTQINEGLSNPFVNCLFISNNVIYAGTSNGLFSRPINGTSWTILSNNLFNSNITSLLIDDVNIYAGTNAGILFSNDNGTTVSKLNAGIPETNINSLTKIDDKIFSGTSRGIFVSSDASTWVESNSGISNGIINKISCSDRYVFAITSTNDIFSFSNQSESWTKVNNGLTYTLKSVVVSGDNAFAATTGGVYLSSDGGKNWELVNNGLTNTNVNTIAIDGTNIFAGTSGGVFRSTNNGTNWSPSNTGLTNLNIIHLAVKNNKIVAGTSNGIFVSNDNGSNWSSTSIIGSYTKCLETDGIDIYYGASNYLYKSTNNGATWTEIYESRNATIESIEIYESNIFIGTTEGSFLTKNGETSWELINNGLQMPAIALNNTQLFGGSINGVWRRDLADILENPASTPGKQAFNVGSYFLQTGQLSIQWNKGNGKSRIIFMKEDTTGYAVPKDGVTYTADNKFGSGSEIDASGWYCVSKGSGENDTIVGLKSQTTYRVMVLEYNGEEGFEKYLTSTEIKNPTNHSTKEGVEGLVESSAFDDAYATSFSYKHLINSEGDSGMISHGVCWAQHPSPTLSDSVRIDGYDIGSYKNIIGGLTPNTSYYARSFVVYPNDTVFSKEFLFTTKSLQEAMVNAYDMLMPPIPPDYSYTKDPNNWAFGSIAGGDANKGSDIVDQPNINWLQRYENRATHPDLERKWDAMYSGVIRCNDALICVNKDASISSTEKETKLGELYFLRAFYNFELIKMFGAKLPWIDEINMYSSAQKNNDNPIWTKVELDFQNAISRLPQVSDSAGQVNVWAAKAFYAKILLYQQKYTEAKAVFDDVIANGKTTTGIKYALLTNFDNNFNLQYNNNAESVYAQQSKLDGKLNPKANTGYNITYPSNYEMGTCCGFFQPSNSLVNSFKVDANGLPLFDPSHNTFPFNDTDLKNDYGFNSNDSYSPDNTTPIDPRLDWTVGRRGIPYLDWGINPGKDWIRDQTSGGPYLPIKHMFRKADKDAGRTGKIDNWLTGSELNYNLMRYADVLLMAAECEVELGNLMQALTYVNQIRNRASISKVKNGSSDAANYQIGIYSHFADQSFAREAIRFERKLELAMEGHRFFDLARWGGEYAAQELNAGYLDHEKINKSQFSGVTFDTCQVRYTIPQIANLYLPPTKYLNDSAFTLNTETFSGLPVSYTVSDNSVVEIIDNKLHIRGLGEASITVTHTVKEGCLPSSIDTKVIKVIKKSQQIKFDTITNKRFDDEPHTLVAKTTSGLPVSFSVKNNSIIRIVDNQFEIVGTGVDTIYASQEGNEFYDAAPTRKQIVRVLKSTQSITFDSIGTKLRNQSPIILDATSSSGLPVSYYVNDTSVVKIIGNQAYLLGLGTDTIYAKQAGNENYEPAPEVYRLIKVNVGTGRLDIEENQLQVYPNPTNGLTTIILPNIKELNIIKVMDLNGRMVYQKEVQMNSLNKVDLDLSVLEAGSYIIKVSSNSHSTFCKIVKK